MQLPVLRLLPDGSYLSNAAGLPVRVIDAALTTTTEANTLTTEYGLVTTLLDPRQAPALAPMSLYHERWEIETAYCEHNHASWAAGCCGADTPPRSSRPAGFWPGP